MAAWNISLWTRAPVLSQITASLFSGSISHGGLVQPHIRHRLQRFTVCYSLSCLGSRLTVNAIYRAELYSLVCVFTRDRFVRYPRKQPAFLWCLFIPNTVTVKIFAFSVFLYFYSSVLCFSWRFQSKSKSTNYVRAAWVFSVLLLYVLLRFTWFFFFFLVKLTGIEYRSILLLFHVSLKPKQEGTISHSMGMFC